MLLYVVLFSIASIALCCFGGWCCTKKYFSKESNQRDMDDSDENIGIVQKYQSPNRRKSMKKWAEVDQEDTEYMLKAFDDDEALQNFYDSDGIEMTCQYTAGYAETLDFSEKQKILSAFDED